MSKKTKLMNDLNEESLSFYSQDKEYIGFLNGFLCPDCQNELVDTNPLVTILDRQSKKEIGCNKCGYTGYRVI